MSARGIAQGLAVLAALALLSGTAALRRADVPDAPPTTVSLSSATVDTGVTVAASDMGPSPSGAIPAGLPSQLLIGLFEGAGDSWMAESRVPWGVRYTYATYGWVNNWGYGPPDGRWVQGYFDECRQQKFIPALQYYVMNGEPGGGEAQFLDKARNPLTMASYFGDFKLLMERARAFGRPVMVLVEADGFGFLEKQSGGRPGAYAAVASSGMPELADLPNTVAGWGLAFLKIRQAVGATNVILGMHVSAWAGGHDIGYSALDTPIQHEVDKVYTFLKPLGLGPNQTGATYDVLVGDPLDRDSNYYLLEHDQDRWWDPSDAAPVTSRSFNRYAEWLRLWNVTANRRWVLWQIPLGNQWSRDVPNDGTFSAGWKDNRTEYFFGSDSARHLRTWASDGVMALLFGAGIDGQSSYRNDDDALGMPYLQGRAALFYETGGLPLE